MCSQGTSAFSWDRSPKKNDRGQQQALYQIGLPEIVLATSPSLEKTFKELNSNSVLNPTKPFVDHTLEDAIKKARENFAALISIKDSCTLKNPT